MKRENELNELAEAFKAPKKSKKPLIAFSIFGLGILALILGAVFLVLRLTAAPKVQDAEFLVQTGEWTLEDGEGVVWNFTEIGKGTLTTNGHTNDYEFKWALEDGEFLIETEWLYTLENRYDYALDQENATLTLTSGDETFVFTGNML